MRPDDPTADTPTAVVDRDIERVFKEANAIWERRPNLSPREEQLLHALWGYGNRLNFLRVLMAIADPHQPVDPEGLRQVEQRFRDAIIAFGSATEDNVRAASAMSLRPRRLPRGATELAFEVGPSPTRLADVLLAIYDIVGSADFFNQHLRGAPELKELTPELWEDAFRALMLTTSALFTSPEYSASVRGSDVG